MATFFHYRPENSQIGSPFCIKRILYFICSKIYLGIKTLLHNSYVWLRRLMYKYWTAHYRGRFRLCPPCTPIVKVCTVDVTEHVHRVHLSPTTSSSTDPGEIRVHLQNVNKWRHLLLFEDCVGDSFKSLHDEIKYFDPKK